MTRPAPTLHRDDPGKEPLLGHVKVTREDWLNAGRFVLIDNGVAAVKVLTLAERLQVSRSSFYWYFKGRRDLLDALLEDWEGRNTTQLIAHCALPARNISEAVCNFFRCFVDPSKFDPGLDFAVRAWARRESAVRNRIDHADAARLSAIQDIYSRFGYDAQETDARSRILYFQQLGYHALDLMEPIDVRLSRLEGYLFGFTGVTPDRKTVDDFLTFSNRVLR
ncbi:MAG: TetR/AcrR family transcriptional regulator [Pseudomonadota bacterium]